MDEDERRQTVTRLRQQIEQGAYRVDPQIVAEALLARLRDAQDLEIEEFEAGWRGGEPHQNECSYPRSSRRSESAKRAVGVPARTRPIQVSSSWQLSAAAAATWRALGGTQTQSS